MEPLDPNPVNHHPKEHPLVITTLADLRRLTSTSQDGCWVWSGPIDKDGYGRWPDRHPDTVLAHRIAFILANGPVPSELEVDHTCRVRACCNPEHLEAVTHAENMRRTRGLGARAQRETCHRGHPYDESNTHRDRDGHRVCRKCQVIRTQQYRARRAS